MYIAEIRGKIPSEFEYKEDVLTSNVFSFFKYASRAIFLGPFLEMLGVHASKKDLEEAEFIFWPTYEDGTEPDVVILVGDHYVLIEAKYTSGFGQETKNSAHQLYRENLQGSFAAKALGKHFKLVALTNDVFINEIIYPDIDADLMVNIIFINWQSITYLIEAVLNTDEIMTKRDHLLAGDLHELLIKKGLRSFEGIEPLEKINTVNYQAEELFYQFKTSRYYGEFQGFLNRLLEEDGIDKQKEIIFWKGTYE